MSIKNIRKLEFLLEKALPIRVDQESILKDRLSISDIELSKTNDPIEKAEIYIYQGDQLKARNHFNEAIEKYNKSINQLKTSYGAIKGKIECFLSLGIENDEFNELIDYFCDLAPTNPIIGSDLIEVFFTKEVPDLLIDIFKRQLERFPDNEEAKGNFSFHLGLLYLNLDTPTEAKVQFEIAKEHFNNFLESNHAVFNSINEALNLCNQY